MIKPKLRRIIEQYTVQLIKAYQQKNIRAIKKILDEASEKGVFTQVAKADVVVERWYLRVYAPFSPAYIERLDDVLFIYAWLELVVDAGFIADHDLIETIGKIVLDLMRTYGKILDEFKAKRLHRDSESEDQLPRSMTLGKINPIQSYKLKRMLTREELEKLTKPSPNEPADLSQKVTILDTANPSTSSAVQVQFLDKEQIDKLSQRLSFLRGQIPSLVKSINKKGSDVESILEDSAVLYVQLKHVMSALSKAPKSDEMPLETRLFQERWTVLEKQYVGQKSQIRTSRDYVVFFNKLSASARSPKIPLPTPKETKALKRKNVRKDASSEDDGVSKRQKTRCDEVVVQEKSRVAPRGRKKSPSVPALPTPSTPAIDLTQEPNSFQGYRTLLNRSVKRRQKVSKPACSNERFKEIITELRGYAVIQQLFERQGDQTTQELLVRQRLASAPSLIPSTHVGSQNMRLGTMSGFNQAPSFPPSFLTASLMNSTTPAVPSYGVNRALGLSPSFLTAPLMNSTMSVASSIGLNPFSNGMLNQMDSFNLNSLSQGISPQNMLLTPTVLSGSLPVLAASPARNLRTPQMPIRPVAIQAATLMQRGLFAPQVQARIPELPQSEPNFDATNTRPAPY